MKCDVLVVGAGPGGSAAAYWLARAGIDVLLCDKAHFPRNKPCGDGLTPRAVAELERLDLGDFARKHGHPFSTVTISRTYGAGEPYVLRSRDSEDTRRGLVISRRVLDEALRDNSVKMGARFLPGFAVSSLVRSDDTVRDTARDIEVRGHCRGTLQSICARLVVIATGASRTFAHSIGLTNSIRPQAVALRGYVSGPHGMTNALEVLLDPAILPGYGWIFPVSDTLANVGVGVVSAHPQDGNQRMRKAFTRLLSHPHLAQCQLTHPPQGFPLRTDFPDVVTHANNVLVVGEAAGLVDPLTGEGIAFALESGRLAAEIAISSLSVNDVTSTQLASYSLALQDRYANYFRDSRELLSRLNHPKVVHALDQVGGYDHRVRHAFRIALLNEQPRKSIRMLCDVLQDDDRTALAQAIFQLNAYQPLLERCREYILEQIAEDAPDDAIIELVRRGKMLRALLVFVGCEAAGGNLNSVLAGAGGIELIHAASLVHDDVMDNAAMRRGLPAIHTKLGAARAVVCGDYLIAKAFRLLAASQEHNPPANVVQSFIVGAESGIRACKGQFQDVGCWSAETLNAANYYDVVSGKTSAVISGALRAGAALAGGDEVLASNLERYGKYVGLAFQIRDDLLDFVDPNALMAVDRKPSLPIVLAFERSTTEDKELILRFLNDEPIPSDKLLELIVNFKALEDAERVALHWSLEAVKEAMLIPNPNASDILATFARYSVLREE